VTVILRILTLFKHMADLDQRTAMLEWSFLEVILVSLVSPSLCGEEGSKNIIFIALTNLLNYEYM
jgi:hypothetical protein